MGLFWHSHTPRGVLAPAAHSPLLSSGYLWMPLRRSYSRSLSGQNRFRKTSRGTRSWLGRWKTSSRSVPRIASSGRPACVIGGGGGSKSSITLSPQVNTRIFLSSRGGDSNDHLRICFEEGLLPHGDRPGLSPWGSARQLEVWLCSQHVFG